MQAFNLDDKVFKTLVGSREDLETKAEELRKDPTVRKVVVADLPRLGDTIVYKGLRFRIRSELSRNRYVIQLVGPEDE